MTTSVESQSKFNLALIARMFRMTRPFWSAYGRDQKWYYFGFLLAAMFPMYHFFSFGKTWVSVFIKPNPPVRPDKIPTIPFVWDDLNTVGFPLIYFIAFGLLGLISLLPPIRKSLPSLVSWGKQAYRSWMTILVIGICVSFYQLAKAYGGWVDAGSPSALEMSKYLGMLGTAFAWLALPTAYYVGVRKKMSPGWRLLALVTVLLFVVAGINAYLSYVQNGLFTFLQNKMALNFGVQLAMLGCVFVTGIIVIPVYYWVRDSLGNEWRLWMTNDILDRWMANRKYLEINQEQSVENPDQRVSEDPRGFTQEALKMMLLLMDAALELAIYAMILFTISNLLGWAVIIYAATGSFFSVWIGRRLIGINFMQEAFEAFFRYQTVYTRDNAEAIAFYRGEKAERSSISKTYDKVYSNFKFLLYWQRNLTFFSKGYSFLIVIVPMSILAPLYFASKVELGDVMQGMNAFSHVLAALSLLIAQFPAITKFAANCNRLADFVDVLDRPAPQSTLERPRVTRATGDVLEIDGLKVITPDYARTLVSDLSTRVEKGESLVIMGPSGTGKSTILRNIAGLINAGEGSVTTPAAEKMMFLPQKAYLPLGSLRWQLTYPNANASFTDDQLRDVLKVVNLEGLDQKYAQHGGFDAELPWQDRLSLGEQQRVALARLLLSDVEWVFLDEASSALDADNEARLYRILQEGGKTLVSVGHRQSLLNYHKRKLELDGKGGYTLEDTAADKA